MIIDWNYFNSFLLSFELFSYHRDLLDDLIFFNLLYDLMFFIYKYSWVTDGTFYSRLQFFSDCDMVSWQTGHDDDSAVTNVDMCTVRWWPMLRSLTTAGHCDLICVSPVLVPVTAVPGHTAPVYTHCPPLATTKATVTSWRRPGPEQLNRGVWHQH